MSVSHCRVFYECRFVLSGLIESAVTVCNAYNAGAVSDGGARNRDLFSIFTVRMRTMSFVDRCFADAVSAKKVYCNEGYAFSAGYRVGLAVGEYASGGDGLG